IDPIPVLLYGKDFWSRVVNFEALCEEGVISPRDLDIFTIVETAEEGWEVVRNFYRDRHEDRANPTAGDAPQPPLELQGFPAAHEAAAHTRPRGPRRSAR